MAQYIEKSGESKKDAIVVLDVENEREGVRAEYEYLEKLFGQRNIDWKTEAQYLLMENEMVYDKIVIRLSDGKKKEIFFNITFYFGK
ncbi:MAG: hypothetical protein GXO87_11840 [Chlorobi bacterium]|nr:hypothetical protein [Chlorobiota bacterium]